MSPPNSSVRNGGPACHAANASTPVDNTVAAKKLPTPFTNGIVRLEGVFTSSEIVADEMVQEIQPQEGVRGVDDRIVVGLTNQEWEV